MSAELMIANVVRQIIVKAWNEPEWKRQVMNPDKGNARPILESSGFKFPTYNGVAIYPNIKVVECVIGEVSYIVLPPNPTNPSSKDPNILTDLAMVAARGNTVLGI